MKHTESIIGFLLIGIALSMIIMGIVNKNKKKVANKN